MSRCFYILEQKRPRAGLAVRGGVYVGGRERPLPLFYIFRLLVGKFLLPEQAVLFGAAVPEAGVGI